MMHGDDEKENSEDRCNLPRYTGFTLIELLIVIAVIAVLAAILFPVFARARESARRSSCQNNLKQIGLGLMQYTQDFDETLPTNWAGAPTDAVSNYANSTGNWVISTQPYIKSWQVLKCPSTTANTHPTYKPILTPNPSDTNYLTNAVLIQRKMAALQSPSSLIWLHEFAQTCNYIFMRPTVNPSPAPALPLSATIDIYDWLEPGNTYSKTHFDGGNLLFADGHVKWRRQVGIGAREFGLDDPANQYKGEQPLTLKLKIDTSQVAAG